VPLSRPDPDQLLSSTPGESTAASFARVAAARARAAERGDDEPPLAPAAGELLADRLRAGALSARGLHKLSRVARTVADLAGDEIVTTDHVADALALRTARSVLVS
jgi:magnesium chelatase family protein